MTAPAVLERPRIRPEDRVEIPLGGAVLVGTVTTVRAAGRRTVLGLRDSNGRLLSVEVEPDTALGLAVVVPATDVRAAVALAGMLVGGGEPSMPVQVQIRTLARALLSVAPEVLP